MSALQYFDHFDQILVYKLSEFSRLSNNANTTQTMLLKDLLTYGGKLQSGLLNFIGWLISNNDRELQFAAKCNIKFLHSNSNIHLLKIILFVNSRCNVHKKLSEWTGRIVVNWQRHCEKQRLLGIIIQHDDFSFRPDVELVSRGSSLKVSVEMEPQSSIHQSNYKDSNDESPIVGDIYSILEEMESKIRKIKDMYAQSGATENLSTQRLLRNLTDLNVRNSTTSDHELAQTFRQMDQQMNLLKQLHISKVQSSGLESNENFSNLMTTLWEEDEYIDSETTIPADKDEELTADTFNDNKSAGSNCSTMTTSDLSRSQGVKLPSTTTTTTTAESSYSKTEKRERPTSLERNKGPTIDAILSSPLTMEALTIHRSKTELSLSSDQQQYHQLQLRNATSMPCLSKEVESALNRAGSSSNTMTAEQALPTSEKSRNYNYVMSRMGSSDSLSSAVEESTSGRSMFTANYNSTNAAVIEFDSRREEENKDIRTETDSSSQRFEDRKVYKLRISLNDLPKSTRGLMALFDISSPSVFDGELVAKKSSSDFMYKKRYLWINPASRSLHWAKHRVDAAKSKFFMLKRVRSGQKPSGLIQGVVHSAEFGPKGLVICTENGSYLELKLPMATLRDWERVFLALI